MSEGRLHELFEKMYFHEMEKKEKIFTRLNIPFAATVALVGYYAFVLSSGWEKLGLGVQAVFCTLFFFSAICTFSGSVFFILALLGRMDKAILTANELEAYRQKLVKHYEGYDGAEKYVADQLRDVMYRDFMECSTVVTLNNERKVHDLFYCNFFLVYSSLSGLACYILVKMATM